MIRHSLNSYVVLAGVLSLSAVLAAKTADMRPGADSLSHESDLASVIIPNSAVSESDNCSRISEMEEEFEAISPSNLQRIDLLPQTPALGVSGKFRLAVANVSDPFNILTIAFGAEMDNAGGGPSPLPRGAVGFGQRFGVAMVGGAAGEFFSTFLVSSIFHQDPHYRSDPAARPRNRVVHALSYVVITRSDSGRPMFNFAEFLGTAGSSIVEGSLHPEWERTPGATAGRIFISIGSDAAFNLMTEFLPDVSRRLNPRLMLLRRLADKAAAQN